MNNNTYASISYAERAGMYLRRLLIINRKIASEKGQRSYRDGFAADLGVETRTLNRCCKAMHDIDTIARVAALLGISVEEMINFDAGQLAV